jgi:sterol desaturase/sphingolipid hydroxylase (fatty acid hydroxylase superfamily)
MENLNLFIALLIIGFRYFIFAGIAYLFFYVWKINTFIHKKIQPLIPERRSVLNEIKYSISTIIVFSFVFNLIFFLRQNGYSKTYIELDKYGYAYFILSLPMLLLIHDFYFYCIHRLMHHPKLFKHVHTVHHRSHNPTPFAAFAFHPLEAFLEIGIVFIVLIIPINRYIFILFSFFVLFINIFGHLGFELYGRNFLQTPLGKVISTSTHHNMHHKYANCNYGLYSIIWDRIFKSNHKKYEETFTAVAQRDKKRITVAEQNV